VISDPDIGHWKIGHNDHGEGAGGAGGAEGSEGAELGRAAVAKGVSYGLPWVVVCTDGAWDVITNDEMVRIVADAEERWAACHRSEGGDTGGDMAGDTGGDVGGKGSGGGSKGDKGDERGEDGGKAACDMLSDSIKGDGRTDPGRHVNARAEWVAEVIAREASVRGTRDNTACVFAFIP
jgi:hypothetical protein